MTKYSALSSFLSSAPPFIWLWDIAEVGQCADKFRCWTLSNPKGKTWCVAKPSTDDTALLSNINYGCNYLGSMVSNCSLIQPVEPATSQTISSTMHLLS
ncbi:alpha-1,2-galactosyltransferase gmh3-like [Hibiscus syriacus]|uniref:Alpha-1,2-galactosyltransferase gmh3-like n=1 Tax=Hibiscus syriacus TaxID=106335 RepID=A0A6A2YB30_HIBSY|nr:alpha-1,2-galactosyltransferase gmh3-like [Hibiscus syriacus]